MKMHVVKLTFLSLFASLLLISGISRLANPMISSASESPNIQVSVDVPENVTPGQTVEATLTVTNAGATPTTNIEVAGILPQRTTHVSGGTPDTTLWQGYTYIRLPAIENLAPGATQQLTHSFQIPANAQAGARYNYEDVAVEATAGGTRTFVWRTLNKIMTLDGGAPPPPAFQGNDVLVSVNTVNPITTGGDYPINVQMRNTGAVTGTNLLFSFPIPAGTTFVSGGTFIANYEFNPGDNFGPHTQLTTNLNPGQVQTFVYTVTVPANPSVGTAYPIQTIYMEHTGGTRLRFIGVNASMLVEAPATLVAAYQHNDVVFNTAVHGFGFGNYGHGTRNWQDDLLPADMFTLFGPGVCQTGTGENCVLTAPAEQQRMTILNAASGGHCEGMAVASIWMFEGRSFKGKTTPQDFGAPPGGTAVDLTLNELMENYIMYYFASQFAPEVSNAHWVNRKKPSEIVQDLIAGLNSGSAVGYTIGIYKPETFAEGHAIIATGVEQLDGEPHKYRILVYDNNFPKQRKYIEVDTQAETWRYSTAASPGNDPSAYTGTEDSRNLEYAPITIRELAEGQHYTCRFCNAPAGQNRTLSESTVTISYLGQGEMLIVDPETDYQIGYDFFDTETFIDTFTPNGVNITVENLRVDPSMSLPPRYTLPYTDGLYEVYIGARVGMSVTNGFLMVEGEGFVMGFDYIDLPDDGSTYRFQISPQGEVIGIDVDADIDEDVVLPAMYLAYDPVEEGEPSVVFQMDGLVLAGGELAIIRLDREEKRFYFETTDPYENFFDLQLTMINADGTTFEGETTVFTPENLDLFYVSYGEWDGGKIPVVLTTKMFYNYLPIVQ